MTINSLPTICKLFLLVPQNFLIKKVIDHLFQKRKQNKELNFSYQLTHKFYPLWSTVL
jgi:hypothetical protein